MKRLHLAALAVLGLSVSASAFAQASAVPNLMSYQSRVADAAGVPLGNTTPVNRIVLFRIYDSPSASAPVNRLYSEQQTVTISGGEFSVLIGSGTAIATETSNAFSTFSAAVFGGATRYLGVTIDDGDGNPFNDPELSPRQQIVGTAFAFRAAVAESVALGGVSGLSLANDSVGTAALAAGSVTGAKLAAGAVGAGQIADAAVGTGKIADAAVGTGQVVDASLTLAKLAPNSIDGSKIVDGSIGLDDLSPAVRATIPKPKYVYNQGLGGSGSFIYNVFPIDIGELGNDNDGCVITYYGQSRFNYSNGSIVTESTPVYIAGSLRGIVFSGQMRIRIQQFGLTPSSVSSYTNIIGASSTAPVPTFTSPTTPLVTVMHTPEFPYNASTYGTGFLNGSDLYDNKLYRVAGGVPVALGEIYRVSIGSTLVGNSALGNPGHSLAIIEGPAFPAGTFNLSAVPKTVYASIHTFYPGSLLTSSQDLQNVSTTTTPIGLPQVVSNASIAAGANKLTITLANPHGIQVGDSITLAGITGTPAANGIFTVTAQPDRMSFEVALTGATGTYSGGTSTYTPKYNRNRIWVAVHNSVALRFIVSDN